MKVKILKTDKRLGIKKGEIYKAKRAGYDTSKLILESRDPDGYEPMCAQYLSEVAHWINNQWMVIENNTYQPEKQP